LKKYGSSHGRILKSWVANRNFRESLVYMNGAARDGFMFCERV
jgi:hypothetical protein